MFGPRPRRYHVKLPRKVKQLARQSALNARAAADELFVIEPLTFERPRTRDLLALLTTLGVQDQRVLVLTQAHKPELYLSSRNLANVHVMEYGEVSTYEVLWSEVVLVEEGALAAPEGAEADA